MEIKLVIDDRLANPLRRLFSKATFVTIAVLTVIGGATYVYATGPTPTNTFVAGTVISSSEVNENFTELYEGVNALEQKHPAGAVSIYAGSVAPSGFLLCDGAAVSRTQYPDLFAAIGTTYGAGDGSTTFNVPDLRGRVAVGLDAAEPVFDTIAASGGEISHVLTGAEMASHTHTGTTNPGGSHNHGVSLSGAQSSNTTTNPSGHAIPYARNLLAGQHADGAFDEMLLYNGGAFIQPPDWDFLPVGGASSVTSGSSGSHSHSFSTSATGNGSGHNNLQPYVVMSYIIAY